MKDPKKIKEGKKNRAAGRDFELRVRKDLVEKGWIVDKWGNNVEFETLIHQPYETKIKTGKLIQAKNKWAGPGRPMMMGAGFPDFIAFRISDSIGPHNYCEVIGVESKINGTLSKLEKEKCKWLLENNIFSRILIAEKTKIKNRIVIKYHDFEVKYKRFK